MMIRKRPVITKPNSLSPPHPEETLSAVLRDAAIAAPQHEGKGRHKSQDIVTKRHPGLDPGPSAEKEFLLDCGPTPCMTVKPLFKQ